MSPYSCIAVAALVMALVPGQAFSAKGFRSMGGLLGFVGHATLAAGPGMAWLAAEPSQVLEALGLTVGCAVAVVAYLLLTRITVRLAPRPAATEPAAANAGPAAISPWALRDTLAGDAGQPRGAVVGP